MLWTAGPYNNASSVSRRSFLAATASLAAASLWADRAIGAVQTNAKFTDYPFQLGVASGDPSPDGFVLWTRLAPKPLEGGGMPQEAVEVRWTVAEDEQMRRGVRRGKTVATPDWAHSVHVEVDGLQPDRWYFYQFQAGDAVSAVGRARTFPQLQADPQRLRFAFASCQHFEAGYYTAYDHMTREDLDFVTHLGDYIYEGAGKENGLRTHVGGKLKTLKDYRNRHAQYKTDLLLQAAHQMCPWLVTWDDHEVENNYAGDISQNPQMSAADFLRQRAAAYKAYYEHMPLRRSALPQGPSMDLYRQVAFGRLAQFYVLDTRQYRTDQPCGDGNRPPCPETMDPEATILGDQQERWLLDGLQRSPSRWNVLAQQVTMARIDRAAGPKVGIGLDKWAGYEQNRRRVLRAFRDQQIANPVVLTGDIHSNWANDLLADFDDPDSPSVGTEFVGTSISSGGDGVEKPKQLQQTLAENPFVKFHNTERGYVVCEVTPQQWRTDYRVVPYVTRPGAPLVTRASFVVQDGQPKLERA